MSQRTPGLTAWHWIEYLKQCKNLTYLTNMQDPPGWTAIINYSNYSWIHLTWQARPSDRRVNRSARTVLTTRSINWDRHVPWAYTSSFQAMAPVYHNGALDVTMINKLTLSEIPASSGYKIRLRVEQLNFDVI